MLIHTLHYCFFAAYTAVYALCVFGFLSVAAFSLIRKDIFKFIALSSREDSRANLYHLSVMSIDVKSEVEHYIDSRMFNGEDWAIWFNHIEHRECSDRWYETNLSRLLNCGSAMN